jgi:hypothetical protein
MNMLSRAMVFMAALGISTPMFRVSRDKTKTTRLAGKRSRCRLQIARGPGSISAKADILQLCRLGRWIEAANMDEDHEHMCGERLFGPKIRAIWRSYALQGDLVS